eukprot:284725_1
MADSGEINCDDSKRDTQPTKELPNTLPVYACHACDTVTKCGYLNILRDEMKFYELQSNKNETILDAYGDSNRISQIMHCFHHLRTTHSQNFEYIHQQFGGECNLRQCDIVKRQVHIVFIILCHSFHRQS